MEAAQSTRLEQILGHIAVGIALLDCANQRIHFANQFFLSLLAEPWRSEGIIGRQLTEVVPEEVYKAAQPLIEQACSTGKRITRSDIPYEGFLEARGRTYWRISIEVVENRAGQLQELLVALEDVTNSVRSRLYLNAVHHVSSAIAGPSALPLVLDRILQAVNEMVGATRCAVLLIDYPISPGKLSQSGANKEHSDRAPQAVEMKHMAIPTATIAIQKGLHLSVQNWHPQLNEQLLLGQVVRTRRTFILRDTSTAPDIALPALQDAGVARRPGSVLCVPIFEPTLEHSANEMSAIVGIEAPGAHTGAVLGAIEVYHRRARGFPSEEVELLEEFAQQAGLAIQNARFFLEIDRLATEQAAARERIEAEVIARTAELALRNQALQDAQAAQQLESARMQLLLERLPSGVMLISADGTSIDVINHQAVELLQRMGWIPTGSLFTGELQHNPASTLQSITINIEELLRTIPVYGASGSLMPYEEQPLFRALRKGEASEAEVHITQPDGQTLFLLVNAAPLRASDGTISNAVLVWHDITTLKALERAREDFFTTMAHELKTPLANIRAYLSALQAKDLQWSSTAQQNHETAYYLETADEQVERLVGMINHFLDASRVEAGALRLDLEPIFLPEMFEDLQDRLEALISSSGRRLQINAAIDLPAVLADYELIMSVLTNLLSNAFRYAPEGDTVLLEAELLFDQHDRDDTPEAEPAGIEIRVSDKGPGINQELQTELFTRFSTFAAQRRPTADRPGQPFTEKRRGGQRWSPATGLGLYISRGIIEAHGSVLTLTSNPGQGATFAFILPIASSRKMQV